MRLETKLGVFIGTPEEISRAVRELGLVDAGGITAPAPTVQVTLQAAATRDLPRPALVDPPSNELVLHEYSTDTGVTKGTRRAYVRAAAAFERAISPKSFLDATQDDARAFERGLLERCRHEQATPLLGHETRRDFGDVVHVRCRKGVFAWSVVKPSECSAACPMFQRQRGGPLATLKALRHFYSYLRDRGLVATNPFDGVARRHAKSLGKSVGKKKYAPPVDEVRALVGAVAIVGSPRDVAIVLALAKWGRRPGHVLLLDAGDVDLEQRVVDFTGVRDRAEARNVDGHSKLQANLLSPIDDELTAFFRDVYFPYRLATWGFYPNEGPLFPGTHGRGYYNAQQVQPFILDTAMEHLERAAATDADRERWRAHRAVASKTRITPGCFRHFFSTTLSQFDVDREWRQRLRGDVVPGAMEDYTHWTPTDLHEHYRMPSLLDPTG